jgi:hypothetical protein
MDTRAGLDDLEKRKFSILPGLELRPLSRPARSQSLYRLRPVTGIALQFTSQLNYFNWCVTPSFLATANRDTVLIRRAAMSGVKNCYIQCQ